MEHIPTTLNAIRKHSPCKDSYNKLLKFLNKTKADDEPLLFSKITEAIGVVGAIWCLRSLGSINYSKVRLFLSAASTASYAAAERKAQGELLIKYFG